MNTIDTNNVPDESKPPFIIEMEPSDELTELVSSPLTTTSLAPLPEPQATPESSADPEFDAYMAIVRLIIGGSIEGAAELIKRLELRESELQSSEDAPGPGEIHSGSDIARYMLVGMALSASEGARRQAMKLAEASDMFWRVTGSAAQPLVNNRLTGLVARPLDRAFDRLVSRGQERVNQWVELGRTHEPGARIIARRTYEEVIDSFISNLAENKELADLVQKKSMGLATEAVDEFRSRTVSADAMAENIVRRILRRPMRQELPQPPEDVRLVLAEEDQGAV